MHFTHDACKSRICNKCSIQTLLGGISLKSYKVTYEKLVVAKIQEPFNSYYEPVR